jgi:hypothetical protein
VKVWDLKDHAEDENPGHDLLTGPHTKVVRERRIYNNSDGSLWDLLGVNFKPASGPKALGRDSLV